MFAETAEAYLISQNRGPPATAICHRWQHKTVDLQTLNQWSG